MPTELTSDSPIKNRKAIQPISCIAWVLPAVSAE